MLLETDLSVYKNATSLNLDFLSITRDDIDSRSMKSILTSILTVPITRSRKRMLEINILTFFG